MSDLTVLSIMIVLHIANWYIFCLVRSKEEIYPKNVYLSFKMTAFFLIALISSVILTITSFILLFLILDIEDYQVAIFLLMVTSYVSGGLFIHLSRSTSFFRKNTPDQFHDEFLVGLAFLLTKYVSYQALKEYRYPPHSWYNDKRFLNLGIAPFKEMDKTWQLIDLPTYRDEYDIEYWDFTKEHLENLESMFYYEPNWGMEEFYCWIHENLKLTCFEIVKVKDHKKIESIHLPKASFMEFIPVNIFTSVLQQECKHVSEDSGKEFEPQTLNMPTTSTKDTKV
jgi:hypothetical protein